MSTFLSIIPDGTTPEAREQSPLSGIPREQIQSLRIDAIIGIPEGMQPSGAPSVAMIIKTPDGGAIFAETSLALLQLATRALTARYGDATTGRAPTPTPKPS